MHRKTVTALFRFSLKKIAVYSLLLNCLLTLTAFSQQLNPGDGIRLTFYNISDATSGDFFVQQNGYIQLPYIGLVGTHERTYESVRKEIESKYNAIYREPELEILPLYKVNVFGEVKTPGNYLVTGVERLSDLLAKAGGETQQANLNKIYLVRDGRKIEINAKEILMKGQALNDIGLQSADQIYVSRKKWMTFRNASTIISATALVITAIGVFSR